MNSATDTIAAIATPPGRGGIGIVRVSGPAVRNIATALLGSLPAARHATHTVFRAQSDQAIDDGIALFFPAPHSFTGEDVLELQGHGGPVVLDLVLARTLELGARIAHPGEFSERAFLNDKLDLAQAEAIADLIDAGSEQAARAALRSLQGEFSRAVHALVASLITLRTYVEAAIDFPEEEIDFLADTRILAQLEDIEAQFTRLSNGTRQGCLLRDGMNLVIAGQPNAGKSSLLNALAGRESAIVTDIPGTTRDVLREHIQIDGMPLHVIDTAGLRDSLEPVEREGIRRAWQAIEAADHLLLVIDDRQGMTAADTAILAQLPTTLPRTLIANKIDLSNSTPGHDADSRHIAISARTGAGIDVLREHLKSLMGYEAHAEGDFIARRRHLDALSRAHLHVETGALQLKTQRAGELLAEELRQAQQALGEITGEFSNEDLLGNIFTSFCIGK